MTTKVYIVQQECGARRGWWYYVTEVGSKRGAKASLSRLRKLTTNGLRIIKRTIKDEVIK